MTVTEIFEVAGAMILALGGGSAIVIVLSGWLGKVWADRLMAQQTARHQSDLETLRAQLKAELNRTGKTFHEKIQLYKEVSGPIVELIAQAQSQELTGEDLKGFERNRLKTTALLALFAPISVFDAYNDVIDYIYDSMEGKEQYTFSRFRDLTLRFLSEVRRDVGLYDDDVTYKGHR